MKLREFLKKHGKKLNDLETHFITDVFYPDYGEKGLDLIKPQVRIEKSHEKKLNNVNKNTEKNKPKAETDRVVGTVTKKQKKVIQGLIGNIGSNEQDVVRKILTI